MRQLFILAALTLFAACTPPAQQSETQNSEGAALDQAAADPLATAAAVAVSEEIGVPVTLAPAMSRTEGEWGWLVAQPWTPEGAAIDWSQTQYAQRASEGMLDGGGTTYALLRRESDQWRVVEVAVGPTDVAWADWGQRHGAPASLFVLPPG